MEDQILDEQRDGTEDETRRKKWKTDFEKEMKGVTDSEKNIEGRKKSAKLIKEAAFLRLEVTCQTSLLLICTGNF